VKRDDQTAEPYGGNKVRKLEFLLGKALAEERRSVLTFGAFGSNHALATALFGTRAGLDVHVVLAPQLRTPYLEQNLSALVASGARPHVVDSFEAALRRAAELRSELRNRDGIEPEVVPFGGTCAMSTAGFVNAGLELAEQMTSGQFSQPVAIYVALGSMGTAAGIALGLAAAGVRSPVIGVRVVPAEVTPESLTERVVAEAVDHLRAAEPSFPALSHTDLALEIRDGFLGKAYAAPTPEALAALETAAQAGLKLETTYTGKAFAALLSDVAGGALEGRSVLFWNTYNSHPFSGLPATPVDSWPEELRYALGVADEMSAALTGSGGSEE
jgi:1-aminocyclopropane-1-carboxylate deaminase/D-cysteine desulfhydrase-like pyridoxal-dependent ACC family enzyme